ncbi:hypothetical protein FSP39_024844 [Pinctada imbricata]|uniref:Uncharacterized protein n=1 Tax=Pinctada imbricata TaxID=66713 RepID=A0AA89C4I9_PINIB|nr:hypothetical protein FSP39_024844 [Pinctada imbricata]
MRTLYDITRQLSGNRKGNLDVPFKAVKGTIISDEKAKLDRWKNHFQHILNRPEPENIADIPEAEDLDINMDPITIQEVSTTKLNNNKKNSSLTHLCHTYALCRVELVKKFPARGLTILDRLTPETRESFSSFCPSNGSDPKYRRGTSLTSFSKHPIYHSNKGDFVAKVTDNHSEYSVESNTSDSGRGGSDCDVHSNGTPTIPEEHIHMPNPTFRPQMSKRPHNQSKESVQSEPIPRSIHFPQIPEYANIPCNNINNVKNHINLSHGHLNGRHQSVPSNNRNCSHVNPLNFRRDKEMPYLYHKHKPSVHWRHDMSPLGGSVVTLDEDGSTTTSGSYTVDDSGNEYAMTVV